MKATDTLGRAAPAELGPGSHTTHIQCINYYLRYPPVPRGINICPARGPPVRALQIDLLLPRSTDSGEALEYFQRQKTLVIAVSTCSVLYRPASSCSFGQRELSAGYRQYRRSVPPVRPNSKSPQHRAAGHDSVPPFPQLHVQRCNGKSSRLSRGEAADRSLTADILKYCCRLPCSSSPK